MKSRVERISCFRTKECRGLPAEQVALYHGGRTRVDARLLERLSKVLGGRLGCGNGGNMLYRGWHAGYGELGIITSYDTLAAETRDLTVPADKAIEELGERSHELERGTSRRR